MVNYLATEAGERILTEDGYRLIVDGAAVSRRATVARAGNSPPGDTRAVTPDDIRSNVQSPHIRRN